MSFSPEPAVDRSQSVLAISDLRVDRPSFRVELPSLELGPGDFAALVGRSGSGKSTLLRAIVGEHARSDAGPVVQGQVRILGRDWPPRKDHEWRQCLRADLAWLPQDPVAALDPVARIGAQLERLCGRRSTAELVAALDRFGVGAAAAFLRRYPHQVSGGEAQRVWLACAWLRRPALILADEPTASLDGLRIEEWVSALRSLRAEVGCSALIASHDADLVSALAASTLTARSGEDDGIESHAFGPGVVAPVPWPVLSNEVHAAAPILRLEGVGVRVGRAPRIADIDLEVGPGESIAIQGPSGAGKTTVARVLAGHLAPTSGRRWFDGPRTGVQMLFQNAYQSLTPGRTIRWLVEEVAAPDFEVENAAAALGMDRRLDVDRDALSGGERRRAALLRCLAVLPRVLVLDEPTASLDPESALGVVRSVLRQQAVTGMALVWITHDEGLARAVAGRFLSMADGRMMIAAAKVRR